MRFVVGERAVVLYANDFSSLDVPHTQPWGPSDVVNETRGPQKLPESGSRLEIEMQSGDVIAIVADRFDFSEVAPSVYDMYKGDAWLPQNVDLTGNVAATLLVVSLPSGPAVRYTQYPKDAAGVREWMRSYLQGRVQDARPDAQEWSFVMLVVEHTPRGAYAPRMFQTGANPSAPEGWLELPLRDLVAPALRFLSTT